MVALTVVQASPDLWYEHEVRNVQVLLCSAFGMGKNYNKGQTVLTWAQDLCFVAWLIAGILPIGQKPPNLGI